MGWLEELMGLVPPGDPPRSPIGSALVDDEDFPESYVRLVDVYGPGYFDDFLYLLSPGNPNRYLDARYQTQVQRDALRVVNAGGEELPGRIRSIDDLWVWAMTDNGDVCYWMSSDVGGCVAIMDDRAPEWCFYTMSIIEFLYRLLCKDIVVPIFPPDFPGLVSTFSGL